MKTLVSEVITNGKLEAYLVTGPDTALLAALAVDDHKPSGLPLKVLARRFYRYKPSPSPKWLGGVKVWRCEVTDDQ